MELIRRFTIPMVFIVCLSVTYAGAEDLGGFAEPEEIIGIWEMIPLPFEQRINNVNPWPAKYQYYYISHDGKFCNIGLSGSSIKVDGTYKDFKKVFETNKKSCFDYSYKKNYFFVVTRKDLLN